MKSSQSKFQGTSYQEPREISDDGLDRYLKNIGWNDDQNFSPLKWKKILIENIHNYFDKRVSLDFIIGLGTHIYHEDPATDDVKLLSVTCGISDLIYTKIDNKKVLIPMRILQNFLSGH